MSLSVQNLSFDYGKTSILKDIQFSLQSGEVLGIIGPNGAGKSTIVKLLTRILKAKTGSISLNNQDITKLSRLELAKHIAVVPQASDLPEAFTAQEIVMMGRTPHLGFLTNESEADYALVEKMMKRTDTWKFAERSIDSLDTWKFAERSIDSLSGGEKQRVLLARALVQEPKYLLLDEPTNHLDLRYQVEVLQYVQAEVKQGVGALVVLHDLNLAARACQRILVLHNGSIVAQGKPNEILTTELIQNVYGAQVSIFTQPDTGETVVMPNV